MIKKPNRHTKIVETDHFNKPLSIPNPPDITAINYLAKTERNSIFKGTNFAKNSNVAIDYPFTFTTMPSPTFDSTFFCSMPETFPTTIADNDPIQHSLIPHYHIKHPKWYFDDADLFFNQRGICYKRTITGDLSNDPIMGPFLYLLSFYICYHLPLTHSIFVIYDSTVFPFYLHYTSGLFIFLSFLGSYLFTI